MWQVSCASSKQAQQCPRGNQEPFLEAVWGRGHCSDVVGPVPFQACFLALIPQFHVGLGSSDDLSLLGVGPWRGPARVQHLTASSADCNLRPLGPNSSSSDQIKVSPLAFLMNHRKTKEVSKTFSFYFKYKKGKISPDADTYWGGEEEGKEEAGPPLET